LEILVYEHILLNPLNFLVHGDSIFTGEKLGEISGEIKFTGEKYSAIVNETLFPIDVRKHKFNSKDGDGKNPNFTECHHSSIIMKMIKEKQKTRCSPEQFLFIYIYKS